MLGEKIGEGTGKVTARRVVVGSSGATQMETSFEASGTLLGVGVHETATYVSGMRSDGSLFGEGRGLVMGKGGEGAAWKGQGVGTIKKDGSVSYRGCIFYETKASPWSRLNGCAVVFEFEVDAQGHTKGVLTEWR